MNSNVQSNAQKMGRHLAALLDRCALVVLPVVFGLYLILEVLGVFSGGLSLLGHNAGYSSPLSGPAYPPKSSHANKKAHFQCTLCTECALPSAPDSHVARALAHTARAAGRVKQMVEYYDMRSGEGKCYRNWPKDGPMRCRGEVAAVAANGHRERAQLCGERGGSLFGVGREEGRGRCVGVGRLKGGGGPTAASANRQFLGGNCGNRLGGACSPARSRSRRCALMSKTLEWAPSRECRRLRAAYTSGVRGLAETPTLRAIAAPVPSASNPTGTVTLGGKSSGGAPSRDACRLEEEAGMDPVHDSSPQRACVRSQGVSAERLSGASLMIRTGTSSLWDTVQVLAVSGRTSRAARSCTQQQRSAIRRCELALSLEEELK
eukprot:3464157-Rhodomonas_salina.1